MLVCYLDDSGKDPQNSITTIAGYVTPADGWWAFEEAVEPIFERYDVPILHAKDLFHTEGCFEGWSAIKKQSFIAQVAREMKGRVLLGVSMSALKGAYKISAGESGLKRTVTPYTACFNVIANWMLDDYRTGKEAWSRGVSFVVEAGHENNSEAELEFHAIRKNRHLEEVLRSLSFVGKEDSRAIQMADFLAFYSRRDGVARVKAGAPERDKIEYDQMLKIVGEGVQHRTFVATEFAWGSP